MSYKRLIPCIFIADGAAVTWFNNTEVLSSDVVGLAKEYSNRGADELLIFNLAETDEESDIALDLIGQISRVIKIPMIVGGNIKELDDIQRILDTGAKRAILNFSKPNSVKMVKDATKQYGNEKLAVSLKSFDELFKKQNIIRDYSSELIFMHRLDLDSVMNVTDIPCIIVTDTMEEPELFEILKSPGVKGLSGRYVSRLNMDFEDYKKRCSEEGIQMTAFESMMEFSEFKLNDEGLLPVIVQNQKTSEVLMAAYMNEEAFENTIKSGRMTYYNRETKEIWVKGNTSGNYQYVKSLTIDCDKDTLLAKVEPLGPACHTGNPSCFFQPIAGTGRREVSPLQILDRMHQSIIYRKEHLSDEAHANDILNNGVDKILKKIGEEATELIIAAKNANLNDAKHEISDLLYHVMVLMVDRGIEWEDIAEEFDKR